MNHKLIGFIFISVISLNALSQDNNKIKREVMYNYLISLPEVYESRPTNAQPVLIYLHGGSHCGNDLELLKGYGLPKLIDEGKEFDFVVVSPQCPINKYWTSENWFDSLYLELKTRYRIDTSRIYVTGISMGGFGAWELAMDYPSIIKAIVPLCGGCNDSLNVCKISHIPVWAFHGDQDNLIPINETERLVNKLQECSGNIKFTKLVGRGHGIQDVFENDEIYDWLLQQ